MTLMTTMETALPTEISFLIILAYFLGFGVMLFLISVLSDL
jgi:hypothetical protein